MGYDEWIVNAVLVPIELLGDVMVEREKDETKDTRLIEVLGSYTCGAHWSGTVGQDDEVFLQPFECFKHWLLSKSESDEMSARAGEIFSSALEVWNNKYYEDGEHSEAGLALLKEFSEWWKSVDWFENYGRGEQEVSEMQVVTVCNPDGEDTTVQEEVQRVVAEIPQFLLHMINTDEDNLGFPEGYDPDPEYGIQMVCYDDVHVSWASYDIPEGVYLKIEHDEIWDGNELTEAGNKLMDTYGAENLLTASWTVKSF